MSKKQSSKRKKTPSSDGSALLAMEPAWLTSAQVKGICERTRATEG